MPVPWAVFLIIAFLVVTTGVIIIVVRTQRFMPAKELDNSSYREHKDLTGAKKLAEAIRIPTVSCIENDKTDWTAFQHFQDQLRFQFPLVHQKCEKTVINGYSLVYHLKSAQEESIKKSGHPETKRKMTINSEPNGMKAQVAIPKRKPILITAHMDVVPVEEGTETAWTHPPFSGRIKNGMVWGRGALDTKVHLIGAMEALERLLKKEVPPERDIYLAFGHDEEQNGQQGAQRIAEYFKKQGLEFDFVLDEGGCVIKSVIEGIDKPVALVGIGEKGYANIRLSVTKNGGHSSMPASHTSLGILAQAICRIENHPFKPRLIAPTRTFLMQIGPHMKGVNRMILANLWLFKPIFLYVISKTNSGNALLRTTIAVTMAQGSPAPNVIPQRSSAVVNSRILPGEDGEKVMDHLKKVLEDLPVDIEAIHLDNPSKLSSSNSNAFHSIDNLIKEFCPGAIVAPYLVMASTDAKKYEGVSENIFRFTPYVIENDELAKMHGTNENISVVNVNRCIDFFMTLMERL